MNAHRYSPEDRPIELFVEEKNSLYMVAVEDHGVGIPARALAKIFDGFYTGGGAKQGLGLGLYVSRNIVESHLGEIVIRSKINHGTTVTVILPALNSKNAARKSVTTST